MKDSGLGEDSDGAAQQQQQLRSASSSGVGTATEGATPRTPTPRHVTSEEEEEEQARQQQPVHHGSRHVVIREPSLRNLPSALREARKARQQQQQRQSPAVQRRRHHARSYPVRRLETARLHARSHLRANSGAGACAHSVSAQWRAIRAAARAEAAALTRSDCADVVFEAQGGARVDLLDAEACACAILSLHRLLFHPWPASNVHLPVVLHCAQQFLVAAAAAAYAEEDAASYGGRSAAAASEAAAEAAELLRASERSRYCDPADCLAATR